MFSSEAAETVSLSSVLVVENDTAMQERLRYILPTLGCDEPQITWADDAAPAVVGRYTVVARVTPPAPGLPVEKQAAVDVSAAVPDPLPALAFTFP